MIQEDSKTSTEDFVEADLGIRADLRITADLLVGADLRVCPPVRDIPNLYNNIRGGKMVRIDTQVNPYKSGSIM